jgi:hypothetical protein
MRRTAPRIDSRPLPTQRFLQVLRDLFRLSTFLWEFSRLTYNVQHPTPPYALTHSLSIPNRFRFYLYLCSECAQLRQ